MYTEHKSKACTHHKLIILDFLQDDK